MAENIISTSSIMNPYVINPRDLTNYNAFRGVTDFTNINQFSQYESGYQALFVLQMPYFMEKLDEKTGTHLCSSFRHMLEYEFRGMDGLPDITSDSMDITDGINTQRLINKVTYDTNTTVQMSYFEKTGGLITKFSETYLTGIKDKYSQAKTYHGLIADGEITDPKPSYEVFTMLYVATDATMLRVERGVLLANCQLTKADTSIYNGNRQDINNKELTLEFNCYPIMNNQVDKAAKELVERMNKITVGYQNGISTNISKRGGFYNRTQIVDSTDYKYGIMYGASDYDDNRKQGKSVDAIESLTPEGEQFIKVLNTKESDTTKTTIGAAKSAKS